jgi:serine/threonine-protein kinase RsbW
MEVVFSLCLPHDEASVPVVRHLLSSALHRLGVSDPCSSDVEIAVTEACTNVLKHADAPDEYKVNVWISPEECQIEVADTGPGADESTLAASGGLQEESGRGIQLMRALVDQLHFVARPDRGLSVRLLKHLALDDGAALARLGTAPAG